MAFSSSSLGGAGAVGGSGKGKSKGGLRIIQMDENLEGLETMGAFDEEFQRSGFVMEPADLLGHIEAAHAAEDSQDEDGAEEDGPERPKHVDHLAHL